MSSFGSLDIPKEAAFCSHQPTFVLRLLFSKPKALILAVILYSNYYSASVYYGLPGCSNIMLSGHEKRDVTRRTKVK